ncbi:hypothetical protein HETIRDRAFT_99057 [Heterobasidion irregulare TC 32-1]|uniref:Uncharacterized protein n=1 Tax=Heterobasidion irregulare (strain TC 32-1) TaxID=747525 RepID=W4KLK6_HETIT|nr:uncharacterized protein HETIRDRAFT_99057 [Heterobasidion irregulare TC 32-1]ETW86584.1 hypothetical protein HETIRDRAFT_99057 [Heterobasidion irregulare TC 32-1]
MPMRSVASILIRFRPPHDIILDVGLDLATEFDGGRDTSPFSEFGGDVEGGPPVLSSPSANPTQPHAQTLMFECLCAQIAALRDSSSKMTMSRMRPLNTSAASPALRPRDLLSLHSSRPPFSAADRSQESLPLTSVALRTLASASDQRAHSDLVGAVAMYSGAVGRPDWNMEHCAIRRSSVDEQFLRTRADLHSRFLHFAVRMFRAPVRPPVRPSARTRILARPTVVHSLFENLFPNTAHLWKLHLDLERSIHEP